MLKIEKFPDIMENCSIDKTNLKKCLVSGLFEEELELKGVKRHFYTYLAPELEYNRKCLVIVPPANIGVLEYLENSCWISFAEKEKIFLHILSPEKDAWQYDGTDADLLNQVYMQIQARDYYVTMQDNIYAIGIGDGATIAQQAAMKMTSEWSGIATIGNLDDAAMLNAEITQETEEKEEDSKVELSVYAQKAPLPVWMVWESASDTELKVREYWKKQNDVSDEMFSCGLADEIYFPDPVYKKSSVNDEKVAQVRITNHWDQNISGEMVKEIWSYISKYGRHRCFSQKALRLYKDPIAYGAEYHTIEIDGYTRCWYEYVPEHLKENSEKMPMVVTMHGRGGSAETFFDLSGMSCVAEERDFIAIFPEASVYQQKQGGIRNVLAWNGTYQGESIDDVKFIKTIIEDVKSRYLVDEQRIYACGQSSGGMMTAELAIRAPEIFAAVSPWSALRDPDKNISLPKKIDPQVPFLFLLGENDWLCVDKKHGQLEYQVTAPIAEFLENLISIYQLDETPHTYRCGEITYYIYFNKNRVPMLIVGTVKDMSHANFPRESWIAYDQFLAKFSRGNDGTLQYLGE